MKIRELTLYTIIVFAIIFAFSLGRITKPESIVISTNVNNQDNTVLEQNDPFELPLKAQNVQVSKRTNFIFPNDKDEDKLIQRQFLRLDFKTRMIIHYIQEGDLETIMNVYGENIVVDENGRLIFEEMDIPELAISLNLSHGNPLQLMNGYTEGDYFSFHYFYNPLGTDRATELFVQYKRENDNWRLINIRTNH